MYVDSPPRDRVRCDYSTRLLFGLGQVRSGSGKDIWGGSYDSGIWSVGKEQWGLLGASSGAVRGKQNEGQQVSGIAHRTQQTATPMP